MTMAPQRPPATRDVAEITEALDQINIEEFRSQYPNIDVDDVWQGFCKVCKNGMPHDHRPNPYKYRDFNKALHNWMKIAAKLRPIK
jgi:hypothetical protein